MQIRLEEYRKLSDHIAELERENEELRKAVSCPPHWMHWISVKSRLPEYDRGVLAFGVDGLVIAACFRYGNWVIYRLDKDGRYLAPYPTTIYYWMPLPEPPEVDDATD